MTQSIVTTSKLVSRETAVQRVESERRQGRRIGFTSGVFDLLHPGHVEYLEDARAQCDFLIVAVNSNRSVRAIKGEHRPICDEQDRARVVAGLASVDLVFLFSEENNASNIRQLKPDLYLKAGEYSERGLSSAKIVEEQGGKVVFVPYREGRSSSSIIDRVRAAYPEPVSLPAAVAAQPMPAIFVDRDGVINEEVEYLHEPEKFRLIPGVLSGLKTLQANGYRIVVVTNQAGIGLGYFTKEDFYRVNRVMLQAAAREGLRFDRIYFCPHAVGDLCSCRKPLPGMLFRARDELQVQLNGSWMIGDSSVDMEAGRAAGCKTAHFMTRPSIPAQAAPSDISAADFSVIVTQILSAASKS